MLEQALRRGLQVFGNLLLGQVAEPALAAGGAAVGAEGQRGQQLAGKCLAKIRVEGGYQQGLFRLDQVPPQEILHLLAMLAVPGRGDQAVETVEEGPFLAVGLDIASLKPAFPA